MLKISSVVVISMDAIGSEPGPVDGSLLTQQHLHRSQLIWDGEVKII